MKSKSIDPIGRGRPRIVAREIPCESCGTIFGQTSHEISRNLKICPECARSLRVQTVKRRKASLVERANSRFHVRLLTCIARLDSKRHEYYVRVKIKPKSGDEDWETDRIYLGVSENDGLEKAQIAAEASYARLKLEGAKKNVRPSTLKLRAKRKSRLHRWSSKSKRNIGVMRVVVPKVVHRVTLPDPTKDGAIIGYGNYPTKAEAREVRTREYQELCKRILPCAHCGQLPVIRGATLRHATESCPNQILMTQGAIKPLFRVKLWNLVFAKWPAHEGLLKVNQEMLCKLGFLYKRIKRYGVRQHVERHLTHARQFATIPNPVLDEDEPFFE